MIQIAEKAIKVYGGEALWRNSKTIEADVSVTGLAFTLKRRPFFKNAKIQMNIHAPISKITPIGRNEKLSGVLEKDWVWLEDEAGKRIAERKNPRSYFPYGRRLFYWDDLDMTYFANYAFWNYFTFPNLLCNPQIEWREKKENILEAIFPSSIPTHSKRQEFLFDNESGKLSQHNYTAEVISSLANAANVVREHAEENGILFPSKRIVSPQTLSGKPLNFPTLINITIHKFQII